MNKNKNTLDEISTQMTFDLFKCTDFWLIETLGLLSAGQLIGSNLKKVKSTKITMTDFFLKKIPLSIRAIPPFYMLLSYSIETLLKAVLTSQGKTPEQTHNLEKLSAECGIGLSNNECKMLKAFSAYSIWAGRYPIPKSPIHFDSDNFNEAPIPWAKNFIRDTIKLIPESNDVVSSLKSQVVRLTNL